SVTPCYSLYSFSSDAFSSSLCQPGNQRDKKENEEQEKQNLRNVRCRHCDSGEPEHRSHDRNDEKDKCPIQHSGLPFRSYLTGCPLNSLCKLFAKSMASFTWNHTDLGQSDRPRKKYNLAQDLHGRVSRAREGFGQVVKTFLPASTAADTPSVERRIMSLLRSIAPAIFSRISAL